MPIPSPADPKKELLRSQEESLKHVQQDEAKREEAQKEHAEEKKVMKKREAEAVGEGDEAERLRSAGLAAWRKKDEEHQREVAADQRRRAEETRLLKENREKEEVYAKKKQEYMKSLHDAAARKGAKDRWLLAIKQDRDRKFEDAEHRARDAKYKLEQEESAAKNRAESDRMIQFDVIERETKEKGADLFRQDTQTQERLKAGLQSQLLQAGNDEGERQRTEAEFRKKTDDLQRKAAEKRSALENERRIRRKTAEQDAVKKKADAEQHAHEKHEEIDHALVMEKARIEKEYEDKKAKGMGG